MLGRRVEYYNGLAFGYQNMQRDIEVKECQRTHEAAKGTVSFGKMLEMPAVFTIQMSSECVAMNEGSIRNRQGIERTFQLLAILWSSVKGYTNFTVTPCTCSNSNMLSPCRIKYKPRNPFEISENLQIALNFIQKEGKIHIVNIGKCMHPWGPCGMGYIIHVTMGCDYGSNFYIMKLYNFTNSVIYLLVCLSVN